MCARARTEHAEAKLGSTSAGAPSHKSAVTLRPAPTFSPQQQFQFEEVITILKALPFDIGADEEELFFTACKRNKGVSCRVQLHRGRLHWSALFPGCRHQVGCVLGRLTCDPADSCHLVTVRAVRGGSQLSPCVPQ